MNNFNHGSLFSGIGGFDLAAEWMGWNNIFHCEWMPFPRKVLNYHFPKSISYEDITKTNFTVHKGNIDILTGGFPCQPYSQAGKRLGKEDSRHLWPEMLRAIKEIEPTYIVGENVRGLTNWNGGVVFNEVCTDLEDCGYEVQPVLLPACAVGAPHRRDRIWFVAYNHNFRFNRISKQTSNGNNSEKQIRNNEFCEKQGWNEVQCIIEGNDKNSNASNSNSNGFNECNSKDEINSSEGRFNALNDIDEINQSENVTNSMQLRLQQCENGRKVGTGQKEICRQRSESTDGIKTNGEISNASNSTSSRRRKDNRERKSRFNDKESKTNDWSNFPTQSPICGRNDGFSYGLDGITFSKWRQESIKGYGNAIVPQVTYQIFKTIQQLENLQNQKNA